MGELAELIALLHGGLESFTTFHALVTDWEHVGRRAEAARRVGQGFEVASSTGEPVETVTSTRQVWVARPDRQRIEWLDGRGLTTTIVRGDVWWTTGPGGIAQTNEGVPEMLTGATDMVRDVVDGSVLLPTHTFELVDTSSWDRRPALVAVATPRARHGSNRVPRFGPGGDDGADRVELVVDAQTGVILRRASFIDGELFSTRELRSVTFDQALDDELFVFSPPPGTEVRRIGEDSRPPPEHLNLEAAARRCPFGLLAPTRVPVGAHLSITLWPAGGRPPQPAWAQLHYAFDDGSHRLTISQHPSRQRRALLVNGRAVEPVVVHRGETDYETYDSGFGGRSVLFERSGTHVTIDTDLDSDTALDIAESMRPAPTASPLTS